MAYIIKHLDEGTYLEGFSKSEMVVWFTPKDHQAHIFRTHKGAEKIVQKFNCLASKELRIQFYQEHAEKPVAQLNHGDIKQQVSIYGKTNTK